MLVICGDRYVYHDVFYFVIPHNKSGFYKIIVVIMSFYVVFINTRYLDKVMNSINNKISGNNFIDDNHHEIFCALEKLTFIVRDSWDKNKFISAVSDFIDQLENHFLHEEIILKSVNFENIDAHIILHREIALLLRIEIMDISTREEAIKFLIFIRSKIFSHELIADQDYWYLFDDGTLPAVLQWTDEFETGDIDVDKHHQSLANYINRLNHKCNQHLDINYICQELKNFYEYSKFHFEEEEELLGDSLRYGHKDNHKLLLEGLDTLITDIANNQVKISSVGEYLKYWLLKHIQNYDIPAFQK